MLRDVFMMVTRLGVTEVMTSLNMVVGRMSKGLEEDFMTVTTSSSSLRETGEKLLKEEREAGLGTVGEGEWVMLALTLATLFTKYNEKVLQSLSLKTGRDGRGGLTILLMVLNNTLGLCLLEDMRLAK